MPTNTEILASFDANTVITSANALGYEAPSGKEHGSQCIAFETLRLLIDSGIDLEYWGNMGTEEWNGYVDAATDRARVYDATNVNSLLDHERQQGANIGGNYFERTYDGVLADVDPADTVTFRKAGPLAFAPR